LVSPKDDFSFEMDRKPLIKIKYDLLQQTSPINMVKAEQFSCPCGFSITTTGGREDLMKHVMLHKNDHHKDMKLTEEQLNSMIKKVDVTVKS
jgi:predicted small metal-binding protein